MIDYVQKTLESMALELDGYYRRRIFSKSQIDTIILNRKRFENKLLKTKKNLDDYLEYIKSETKLEKIRNKQIIKLGTGFEESDLLLQRNIISIYNRALHYYNDKILIENFFNYCIKKKCYEEMKDTFSKKCLKNVSDVNLWIFCAQKLWEIEDIDGVRNIFLKLTAIKPCTEAYLEFFTIECLYAQKINKLNEELEVLDEDKDDLERGEVALAIYKEMIIKGIKIDSEKLENSLKMARLIPGLEDRLKNLLNN